MLEQVSHRPSRSLFRAVIVSANDLMKPFDLSIPINHRFGRWLITCLSAVLLFLSGIQPVSALTQMPAEAADLSSESFVAAAVKRVGNAVVRIDTERTITRNVPDLFYQDPLFKGFFGPDSFQRIPQQERLSGQGSGFIVDSNGYILTNAHVVNQADRVTVTLKDGRHFDGTVEGADELTDLAVVKIDADQEDLPVVALGDSDTIDVGDWAIAVGNPLGLDNTVTLGIVSTLKRSSATVGIPDKRLDFIQTDAAINPGNSGGPLLNSKGEVIGINTAIRADAMGIGFAIPINKAKSIQGQLTRGEHVAHPYLGIQIADLTSEMAKRNNEDPNASMIIPEVNGVLIIRVLPDTPAANAGLRRGVPHSASPTRFIPARDLGVDDRQRCLRRLG